MADPEGGPGHMNHHYGVTPKSQGPSFQIESATLDSLVRLVVETLDPWDHINNTTLHIYLMWNKFIFSKVKGPPLKLD